MFLFYCIFLLKAPLRLFFFSGSEGSLVLIRIDECTKIVCSITWISTASGKDTLHTLHTHSTHTLLCGPTLLPGRSICHLHSPHVTYLTEVTGLNVWSFLTTIYSYYIHVIGGNFTFDNFYLQLSLVTQQMSWRTPTQRLRVKPYVTYNLQSIAQKGENLNYSWPSKPISPN